MRSLQDIYYNICNLCILWHFKEQTFRSTIIVLEIRQNYLTIANRHTCCFCTANWSSTASCPTGRDLFPILRYRGSFIVGTSHVRNNVLYEERAGTQHCDIKRHNSVSDRTSVLSYDCNLFQLGNVDPSTLYITTRSEHVIVCDL